MDFVINLQTAARNIARSRRRAVVGLLTIATGVVAMMLAAGFIEWIFWAMREGVIHSQLGHIQVVRTGYNEAGAASPFDFLIPLESKERKAIEDTPGVTVVTPRLAVSGLVSHGETTVSFVGDGVDPKTEGQLSRAFRIVRGSNLSAVGDQKPEVILGHGLAHSIGAEPGDTVVLLANTASGGINAIEVAVAGVFTTANSAYDDAALRLPIHLAQSLLRADGVHMWLVLLNETERTDTFLRKFQMRFPSDKTGLEFVPWYARADFYNKTVNLFSRQLNVVRVIIAIIIVLSISNMLVLNVLERTGEIGTLMAIGFRRSKILGQFFTECFLLGLIGGSIGLLLGYGLAELISAVGIPMPPPPGMDEGYTGEIRITWNIMLNAFSIALATAVVAGLYPAWTASRLRVVDALRHNI